MRPLAALPLLALALGGCFGGPCDYPGHWLATWEDAALFDRLPPDGERGGFAVATDRPEGLPFANATMRAQWREFRLAHVFFEVAAGGGRDHLLLNGSQGVNGLLGQDVPPSEVRARFLAFARNVSSAGDDALGRAADAFLASRQVGAFTHRDGERFELLAYGAALPGPLRVEELFERIGPRPVTQRGLDPREQARVSEPVFEAGPWRFQFDRVQRVARGDFEGRPAVLQADPVGAAFFSLEAQEEVPAEAAHRARNHTFEALGLGAPPPAEFAFQSGPVC